ncbi:hypothetical protein IQ37_08605 [Chryseobacterium piperi]|uniref:Uncharacterized protein n=1 Tax=Chryseobacterium piperi TaxID=558152 RepID=A0A086BIW5_9FLAO|nr:hypothetical protein [Chryseobacterium piperi]ASW76043.1 hypothetical protein CJF12_18380 [Chryseobacterium piperi]KFF28879.1 hypothetical protein IQ37_08605 [Chryseobacterium piperi]
MKNFIKLISLVVPMSIYSQVGINTTAPNATLHVKSKTAISTNKVLSVENSNSSNASNMEIYEDSRTYIGKPDNQAPNTTNDALVNLYGTTSRSNLRLINPPSTEDKSNGNSRPGVNYDKLAPAYIDANGYIVKAYDPSSPTALSFDGNYTVPNSVAGVKITDIAANGVVTFKVYSGLVFGPAGTGSNILATISFGVNSGFSVSNFSSGSGSGSTRYPATSSTSDNGSTNISSYTADITFSFGTNNSNLVFFYQSGAIYARISGGNVNSGGINIFESKRFR